MPLVSRTFDQLIDFSRTSAATYVDATGKIVTTPASRNLLTYTQEFDNAAWPNFSASVTPNQAAAPDGTQTADKITFTSTSGYVINQYNTTGAGITYTFSVWLRADAATSAVVSIQQSGGNTANSVASITTEWQRFSVNFTTQSGVTFLRARMFANSNTPTFYAWGAQLEAVPTANMTFGSELVTNGDFGGGTTTGWTAISATLSVSSGAMVVTNSTTAFGLAYQGVTTIPGQLYRISFDVVGGSVPGVVYAGTTIGGFELYNSPNLSAGSYTVNFIAATTTTYIRVGTSQNTSGATSSFDNISVKQITAISGIPSTYTRNVAGTFPPRFDYDPVTLAPKGLLIEEQRTNLLLRSNEFSTSPWSSSAGISLTSAATTSPDGTANGWLWTRSSTASSFTTQLASKAASAITYTTSYYVKQSVGNFCAIRMQGSFPARADVIFNLSTGAIATAAATVGAFTGASATIQPAGNGWYRVTLSATSDTHTDIQSVVSFNSNGVAIDGVDSASNSAGFVYGAQLEAGSFATSYIPTVASQVTRTADVAAIVAPNFAPWYNQSEGTMVVSATAPNGPQTGAFARVFSVNDNSTVEYIDISRNSGRARGFVNDGGVGQVSIDAAAWGDGATARIAFAYKANDFAMSFNGAAVVTDTSGTVPTPFQATIGAAHAASSPFSGHIRSIRYYPTRLTDAQLQALTA